MRGEDVGVDKFTLTPIFLSHLPMTMTLQNQRHVVRKISASFICK